MSPVFHCIASFLLAFLIFIFTKSFNAASAAFLVGVLIDLDHLPDFWALKPRDPFCLKEFLDAEKHDRQRKYIFMPLHGYEWLLFLLLIGYFLGWPMVLTAIILSVWLHLLLDTLRLLLAKKFHPLTYFLAFRLLNKFKKMSYP